MRPILTPVLMLLLFSGLSFALTPVPGCQVLDNITDTEYQLSAQLDGASIPVLELSGSTCLLMNYSNIVFDCNGFDIVNDELPGVTSKMAIYVNGSTTNVTIRNCPSIESYKYGIFVNGADRLNISDNLLYYNQYGIYLSGSDYNVIEGNDMRSNTFLSVYMQASDYNSLTGNMFNKSTLGGGSTGTSVTIASTSNNNNLTDNDFTKAITGLSSGGSYNRFTGNRFYDSANAASLDGADYNTLIGNNVSDMSSGGFSLTNSDYNVIEWNNLNDTGGITLSSTCYRNNVSHNYLTADGSISINGQYNRMINNTGYMVDTFLVPGGTYNVIANNSVDFASFNCFSMTGSRMIVENNSGENCGNAAFSLNNLYDSNLTWNYGYNSSNGFRILEYSGGNRLVNNTVLEAQWWDLDLDPRTPDNCDNYVENLTGSGYRQVVHANESITLENTEVAQVAICGGHHSIINNVSVHGSDTLNNNGILLVFTNYTIINNSVSSDNYYGVYSKGSAYNNYTGNVFADNWQGMEIRGDSFGFTQFLGSFNLIDNNTVGGSSHYGISDSYISPSNTYTNNLIYDSNYSGLVSSQDSIYIANNTVYNNGLEGTGYHGIQLSSSDAVLGDNLIYDNRGAGLYLTDVQGLSSIHDHFYDNGYDVYVESTFALDYAMTEALFDSSAGALENFTNASISDSMAAAAEYYINSTVNYDPPPLLKAFNEKFLDITRNSGTVSIDSVVWHWTDGELAGADESQFAIYQYSAGTWVLLNDTPDVSGNSLTVSSLNPGSDFAILLPTNCPVISASGSYLQPRDYVGAPNSALPLSGSACVLIKASDVVFDCNGYNITDNVTLSTYGILAFGPLTNVTIKNCPLISDYSVGVELYGSDNGFILDSVAFHSVVAGFSLLGGSENNTLISNLAYDSPGPASDGFQVGGPNNILINNTAANNSGRAGFHISGNLGCTLTGNIIYGNVVGVLMDSGSDLASFTGGHIYQNDIGLLVDSSDLTTGSDVHLYGNSEDLRVEDAATVALDNFIFDNPAGDYQDFTNLSINDAQLAGSTYAVSWTSNSSALPPNKASFAQKFVNISAVAGSPSIDSLVWHWQEAELGSQSESRFRLYQYNASGWTLMNGTPNTSANTLSLSALSPSSDFAILEDQTVPPEEGERARPSEGELYIRVVPACNGFTVVVAESSLGVTETLTTSLAESEVLDSGKSLDVKDPVENAFVEITDEFGNEQAKYTDSSGQAYFSPCGMYVTVTAVKSGVGKDSWEGLIGCGLCGECANDEDCPEIYHCIAEQCVPVPCDCGQVINHQCVEYQCCADADCPEGKSCVNHECTFGCQSDDDCLASQYCDIAEGEAGGTCTEIECRCGMITEHACMAFQCCADPDCPENMVCLANKCVEADVTCPSTGLVGSDESCNAVEDGEACANCDYVITGPDGRSYYGKTYEDGTFEVPLRLRGIYTVTLLKDGQVVRTINVEALPRPAISEGEKPATTFSDIAQAFLLILVVVLLLVALTYLRKKGGKRLRL